MRRAGLPARGTAYEMLRAAHQTWLAAGKYCTRFAGPLLVAAVVAPKRSPPCGSGRRGWSRRVAVASLLLGPALTTRGNRRPALDPPRFVLGQLADDFAYGWGVWFGCARNRTILPLRPVVSRTEKIRRGRPG